MTDKYTLEIYENDVICINEKRNLGEFFIDFLDLDLTEYEKERQKIREVLENNDINTMKDFTKNLKIQKNFSKGYESFTYVLLNMSEKMSLKQKYTLYAIYKALHLIDHKYFSVLDYGAMSTFDSDALLEIFDLMPLQTEYQKAMEYCLLKGDTEVSSVKRLKEYGGSIKGKAELIFNVSADDNLHEEYIASEVSSFLYIEFMKMIQNDVYVAKCENCGRYFIPQGKYDTKYCEKIAEGNTKTCRQIGAANSFKNKRKTDPVYMEYEKAYKRFYARKRKNIITQNEFDNWVKNASKLKKEAANGKLPYDEFKRLISDDERWFK